jgi:hypothetical protein
MPASDSAALIQCQVWSCFSHHPREMRRLRATRGTGLASMLTAPLVAMILLRRNIIASSSQYWESEADTP